MTDASNRLYGLLPAIYRLRDEVLGYPLEVVLGILNDQAAALEAQIGQLYDNWFIETCQDQVIPYLGDLVGVSVGPIGASPTDLAGGPVTIRSRRRQVANGLSERAAKGTMASLERLAGDTTGWPNRAIELGRLVDVYQPVGRPQPDRGRLVDIRDAEALLAVGPPFGREAHLVDVRRVTSHRRRGLYNLPSIGIALWRLASDALGVVPATCVDDDIHFTFDPLGRDLPLCTSPTLRSPGAPPAADIDVPALISRGALKQHLEDYYGVGRSLVVFRGEQPVDRNELLVADLSGWRYRARPGTVLVDPVLGRIAFPAGQAPDEGVWTSFSTASVGPLGGGGYERDMTPPQGTVYRVATRSQTGPTTIGAALRSWQEDRARGAAGDRATIEIGDNEVYQETIRIHLDRGQSLEIRAVDGCRPVVRPHDPRENRPDVLTISGPEPPAENNDATPSGGPRPEQPLPTFTLNGLWVEGHPIELTGLLGEVSLQHCTLVPPVSEIHRRGPREERASLIVRTTRCRITVESSVIGRVHSEVSEVGRDPVVLTVVDSIIDGGRGEGLAVAATDNRAAYFDLHLHRVTTLGSIRAAALTVMEDSIVTGRLRVTRRQEGEISFSYVPVDSETPVRRRCQPDLTIAAAPDPAARAAAVARVTPRFDDLRFGAPAFCRLADRAAEELLRGAHDEGEMGAHHSFWLRLRAETLKRRLAEFTPVGNDIDLLYIT